MKIRVIYFAAIRDLVERDEETIEISRGAASTEDLVKELLTRHSRLVMEGVRLAVNEEFVDDSHPLNDGDTVALIPPVSGG